MRINTSTHHTLTLILQIGVNRVLRVALCAKVPAGGFLRVVFLHSIRPIVECGPDGLVAFVEPQLEATVGFGCGREHQAAGVFEQQPFGIVMVFKLCDLVVNNLR